MVRPLQHPVGMRISSLSILVLAASVGVAHAEHRGTGESAGAEAAALEAVARGRARAPERTLSLVEIDAQVKPVSAEIGKCYLDATGGTRGGQLLIQLAIHRRGSLDSVSVSTPGLPAKTSRKIEACVRSLVEPLAFPTRRARTTAVLPYHFQRTETANAGPQLSCWSPRGCPGR